MSSWGEGVPPCAKTFWGCQGVIDIFYKKVDFLCLQGFFIHHLLNTTTYKDQQNMPHSKPPKSSNDSDDAPTAQGLLKKEREESLERGQLSFLPEPSSLPKNPIGFFIADDWKPTPEMIRFACTQGLTEHDAYETADIFKDYWLSASGSKARKRDWGATWRNWVRREIQDKGNRRSFSSRGASENNLLAEMANQLNREDVHSDAHSGPQSANTPFRYGSTGSSKDWPH